MKIRYALTGMIATAFIAAGGSSYGLNPSSPILGPLTNILGALVFGHVANNTALASMPVALGRVRRDGFATAGDGGAVDFTLGSAVCSLNGGLGDGGSQVGLIGPGGTAGAYVGCATADFGSAPPSIKIWGNKNDSNGTSGSGTDNLSYLNAAFAWASALNRDLYAPGGTTMYRVSAHVGGGGNAKLHGDNVDIGSGTGSWFFFDTTDYGFLTAGTWYFDSIGVARPQPTPANTGSFTGNTTSGSTTLTNLSSTTYVAAGYAISGPGIPSGDTISSVSGSTLVLATAATSTATGTTLTTSKTYVPCACNFDFASVAGELHMHNVYDLNGTEFIDAQTGRVFADGLFGQPLSIGFEGDNDQDTVDIGHVHIFPYWSTNPNVTNYTRANRRDLVLSRVDNPYIHEFFAISSNQCLSFNTGANGITSRYEIEGFQCDDNGGNGVAWTAVNNTTGHITDYSYVPNSANTQGESLSTDANSIGNILSLTNYRHTSANNSTNGPAARLLGTGNYITATNLRIDAWGTGTDAAAIDVNIGNYFNINDINPDIQGGPTCSGAPCPWFGGTAFILPQGTQIPLQSGNGFFEISNAYSGPLATFALAGGSVVAGLGTGSLFVVATGGTDAASQSNTASGKISVYYSTTAPAGYKLYNNTGGAVSLFYRFRRMGPNN